MTGHVILRVVLTEEQADALASLATRVTLGDFEKRAANAEEAHRMYSATLYLGVAIDVARQPNPTPEHQMEV